MDIRQDGQQSVKKKKEKLDESEKRLIKLLDKVGYFISKVIRVCHFNYAIW